MEIVSEFNKNLKTIFNFLEKNKRILKIKNLNYENSKISGKYANKIFGITKYNTSFIIVGRVPKLHNVIQSFINYANCKKKKIDQVFNEFDSGRLHIGKSDHIVTEKKQALALAISISNKYCSRFEPKF